MLGRLARSMRGGVSFAVDGSGCVETQTVNGLSRVLMDASNRGLYCPSGSHVVSRQSRGYSSSSYGVAHKSPSIHVASLSFSLSKFSPTSPLRPFFPQSLFPFLQPL